MVSIHAEQMVWNLELTLALLECRNEVEDLIVVLGETWGQL